MLVAEAPIAVARKAFMYAEGTDYVIVSDHGQVKASDGVNRFCKAIACYFPCRHQYPYEWMLKRLARCQVLYNGGEGYFVRVNGGKVNVCVARALDYAPFDDWDNLLDVIHIIKEDYGR